MKINNLTIDGVGGIRNLELSFNDGFNVICGANGIGKTTILNTVADAFSNSGELLKRNSMVAEGKYCIGYFDITGKEVVEEYKVKEFDPLTQDSGRYASDNSSFIIFFGINRIINYEVLNAIPKDTQTLYYNAARLLNKGVGIDNLKGWFVNRFLFEDKPNSLKDEQKYNFEIAKKAFGLLDETTTFYTVDSGSLDIKLSSNRGEIYFEYLSAGYKTCIYLVLGIIKEIEFRFKGPYIKADEFDGVILIDEIDLHLHPTWQARLVNTLKELFPKAQFIVTTHSPSVLQTLSPEEIIPLGIDEEGNVFRKDLSLGKYGLQGWTIEEILHDILDMPETPSKIFEKVKSDFDVAMDAEDKINIKKNYDILQEMLHWDNPLKKLLEIQMIGMEESNE